MSLQFIREGVEVGPGGIPLKLAYGSDFPYREPGRLPITSNGVDGKPSYARGGLSNVWGASLMPFRTADMNGWPITTDDLAPHYRAVLGLMPFSARHDRLEAEFPLYGERPDRLSLNRQAVELLEDLEAAHSTLAAHGISFGASRLAVAGESGEGAGCVYCGQCMYGCPYGFIYNSTATLDRLRSEGGLTYKPGVVVERVVEHGSNVEVRGRTVEDGLAFSLKTDRAFLACGVFSSTRVMLASLEAYDHPVRAADNCYFLLPLLRYRRVAGAATEATNTLAQAFIELNDPSISSNTIHLQVYTYNELFRQQIRNTLGPLDRLFGNSVDRSVLSRLLLIQGYLHSDLSPGIDVTLSRASDAKPDTLSLSIAPNALTRPTLSALLRKLRSERGSIRAWPVRPALRVGEPGRGFHTGGTFPMRSRPREFETDELGRPYGLSRVHLVDASVFPSLPATTITLSVMANAHRIGTAAAR
jgi:choline dehydrogenase-like flavoprotein